MAVTARKSNVEELAELCPKIVAVSVQGGKVEVRELAIDEIMEVAQVAAPLFEALFAGGNVLAIIREHIDDAVAVASKATGRDASWIRALPSGRLIAIVKAALEANEDFFVQSLGLAESVMRLVPKLSTMAGALQMPQQSSENTGT